VQEPLVSVAIITYNHAPFIAQAIEGALKQETTFPFELVIGEDRSTDETRDIVLKYQEKYPHVISVVISDENVGMKKNSYRTAKACRGRYLAFCEGDDYWHHPWKLQKQVDYLEHHPECGLLFADCDVYHNGSAKLIRGYNSGKGFNSPKKVTIEDFVDGRMMKWTCTAMIRRNLYEKVIEEDPYLHQSENFPLGDLQLWAEAAALSEVAYVPESLATYRVLGESASRTEDPEKSSAFGKSAAEVRLYLCDKHKLSEDLRRKCETFWYYHSLQLACYSRDARLADELRRKKKKFTVREWLWYSGAKHMTLYYLCRAEALCRKWFSREWR
jgi:glycosyltransferase involved in cell wall biosynthesis